MAKIPAITNLANVEQTFKDLEGATEAQLGAFARLQATLEHSPNNTAGKAVIDGLQDPRNGYRIEKAIKTAIDKDKPQILASVVALSTALRSVGSHRIEPSKLRLLERLVPSTVKRSHLK